VKFGIGAMTDAHWKSFFRQMVRVGVVKPGIDYRRAYTLQFVNKGCRPRPAAEELIALSHARLTQPERQARNAFAVCSRRTTSQPKCSIEAQHDDGSDRGERARAHQALGMNGPEARMQSEYLIERFKQVLGERFDRLRSIAGCR
jgi:hypothetical protein